VPLSAVSLENRTNRLLALLPAADAERISGDLISTYLPHLREVYRSGEPVRAVYFPTDCVVSLLVGAEEEAQVEMATIGNEGAVGIFSLLNADGAMAHHVVQLAGDALRLDIEKFKQHLNESAAFHRLMHRYLYALTFQMIQAGACNQLHRMEERCARWLLMMHDRASCNTFRLTQDLLSEMLGVRRATVNHALGRLKTAGLIQFVRGQITVHDRPGLQSAACPCYEKIQQQYANLLHEPG